MYYIHPVAIVMDVCLMILAVLLCCGLSSLKRDLNAMRGSRVPWFTATHVCTVVFFTETATAQMYMNNAIKSRTDLLPYQRNIKKLNPCNTYYEDLSRIVKHCMCGVCVGDLNRMLIGC